MTVKRIPYDRSKEKEEIERILQENPNYRVVEVQNLSDGDYVVIERDLEAELDELKKKVDELIATLKSKGILEE